jgi:hypothetical protein
MKSVMLVFLVLLATIPTAPDVVAQCRVDCREPEDRPEITEEDVRLANEEQAIMDEALAYECLYRLNEKYCEGYARKEEEDRCWALMPAATPTPTPVPIAPTSAPTQPVDDAPPCLLRFLLC